MADWLAQHPVFSPCNPQMLQRLRTHASLHVAERDTKIAEPNAFFPYLGFVREGVISVTAGVDGPMRGIHRLELYEAHAGAIFGEIGLLAQSGPPGDIIVISKEATYSLIPAAALESAFASDNALLRRFAMHVARQARGLVQQTIAAQGRSATSRVASVLLRFSSAEDGMRPAGPDLAQFTQRDLAAAARCVKESAARAIAELESAGALRREHGHIRSLDRSVLSTYAES